MEYLFLLLLGSITYIMVHFSVGRATRTPVWLLWLVLMIPAIILTGWTTIYGSKNLPSSQFILLISLGCMMLYWVLFQWGRLLPRDSSNPSQTQLNQSTIQEGSSDNSTAEPLPVRPIDSAEEKMLRDCFPWSIYYIQNIEYKPQAVICYGHLRTLAGPAYQQIKDNIEGKFGDRFLLIFQEDLNAKPFFVLVPNPQAAKQHPQDKSAKVNQIILPLTLLFLTLFTTTLVGIRIAGVDMKNFNNDLHNNLNILQQGLPYALGLITILGVHELGHYLTAKFYKIKATLPYFIPVPFFLGTFGAFIKIRSPMPNRKVLFDISIAGPLAGFLATLPLLIWGLSHSQIVELPAKNGLLDPNALNPKYSILLAIIAKLVWGNQLTSQTGIDLHPLAIAGLLGLIVTALNLMPVGQLDGGHIVHAMFGQRTAVVIGQIARILLLLLSFIQEEFLLWAIILLFVPLIDEPALNDVSELDNGRDILGLISIALLLLIVLPLPKTFAHLLHMG
ncbi:site-2 protease family protein [Anabaena sp. FACHB-1237]|uniref:site-2 protease family protein n=1 Tax=Anabaena sp. FACHB-1237 TaxID=2692769 RepID=UPI0016805841|nr:site-2 protease family protein [Anabaena sp. FACHB-1237]MBD2139461.1 site-2 protease family protein [Anabaena sp. FACHB-1237]